MDVEPDPGKPARVNSTAGRAALRDLVLVAGLQLVTRPPGLLVLVGDEVATVLPDAPSVRQLLDDLAAGRPAELLDVASRRALARLVGAGVTESRGAVTARAHARTAARVLIDAADGPTSTAIGLLLASRVSVTTRSERATHALVVGVGEVARGRVERWMRSNIPHLLVVNRGPAVTLGPYVDPGRSSCLHCVDAHRRQRDPAHSDLVAQLASRGPLTPTADPALEAAAMAWAVRDLVTAVEGGVPSTRSATVTLAASRDSGVTTRRREWRRHPECGCAWADLRQPVPTG